MKPEPAIVREIEQRAGTTDLIYLRRKLAYILQHGNLQNAPGNIEEAIEFCDGMMLPWNKAWDMAEAYAEQAERAKPKSPADGGV